MLQIGFIHVVLNRICAIRISINVCKCSCKHSSKIQLKTVIVNAALCSKHSKMALAILKDKKQDKNERNTELLVFYGCLEFTSMLKLRLFLLSVELNRPDTY